MPASVQTIITGNIFAENASFHFDYLEAAWSHESLPRLSAISVRATDESPNRNLSLMHAHCAAKTEQLIKGTGRQAYLFLADAPWQPKSAMVRNKRLWKRYPKLLQIEQNDLSQEIMVESSDGLRYAGIARLIDRNFCLGSQFALEEPHSTFLILTRSEAYMHSSAIRSLMDIAFPESKVGPATLVDLKNVCVNLCAKGDAIGRVSGDWDSREVSIDLVMLPECLDEFDTE